MTMKGATAGIIGMGAAILWFVTVWMQNQFGLFGLGSGPLYPLHQILAFLALAGMVIGFWGIVWGGGIVDRLGKTAVKLYAIAWGMIIFGGLVALIFQTDDSPIFLLFPIGGLLTDISALLIGIATLRDKQWHGWQRYMPLISFLVIFFAVNLPSGIGVTDGPGMLGEIIMGACWFGVAYTVKTAQRAETAVSLKTS